jgi:hypothetical protein
MVKRRYLKVRSRWFVIPGLVLIALSLVWLFAIFPTLTKWPSDYEQEYMFEGSVQVLNPETMSLVEIPTSVERLLTATGIEGDDVLLIKQDVTFYEATSGMPLAAINPALAALDSSEVYGLDRTTRANVSGYGDTDRSGQFTFPADVQQETYSFWSSSASTALPAAFVAEETYQGITVYAFEINVTSQLLDIITEIKVEPVSGIPVYTNSTTIVKTAVAPDVVIPTLINNMSFTSDTVDEMVDLADSTGSLMLWAGVYGFWIVLGLGSVLTVTGIIRSTRAE